MTTIAYTRRLERDDLDRQNQQDIIAVHGIDQLYEDRNGSTDGLRAAFAALQQGDVLVVARLSQFGLGIGQLLKFISELRLKGAHLVSPSDGINTTDRSGWDFYQHCFALIACEQQLAREGNTDLLTIGPARGRSRIGRPKKLSRDAVLEARRLLKLRTNATSIQDLADQFGCARSTFYKTVIKGRFDSETLS